jgi:hypothetical protein
MIPAESLSNYLLSYATAWNRPTSPHGFGRVKWIEGAGARTTFLRAVIANAYPELSHTLRHGESTLSGS